jgi:hypothetical protein
MHGLNNNATLKTKWLGETNQKKNNSSQKHIPITYSVRHYFLKFKKIMGNIYDVHLMLECEKKQHKNIVIVN